MVWMKYKCRSPLVLLWVVLVRSVVNLRTVKALPCCVGPWRGNSAFVEPYWSCSRGGRRASPQFQRNCWGLFGWRLRTFFDLGWTPEVG
jgi:hypothetical protein